MLFQYFVCLLLTLFVSDAFALKLVPIKDPVDLTSPRSPTRREASFTGDLDLQDFESFYWGAPAGNKLIYANLTVFFPEEYRYIVAMERFAGKLKSVQCSEDMVLEFNDDAAFEYAKGVWNWVNNDVNNSFIMVTNYEGCADELERLPFVVSNIRYDEEQNKAFLTADLKDWEEVSHSYTLNVGHMPLTPTHRMLMARGLVPRGPDFSMDLTSSYDKNLFTATVGGWTTSVDAVVRTVGSLNVDFDIDVDWFKLKSAAMTVNPEDVAASLQLALSEHGTLAKAYSWQKTIISIPIEGIEILKVVKLGAFLDVDVGFTMDEWTGTAVANLGARMEISNAAVVKVDLVNSKNNKFSGWTPTFTPIPLTLSAKVEGSAKIYAEPNIKLEASALGKGWSVGLNLQMPYIKADFAALADSTGVCETKKTLGVDIDARIGVELSVQAASKGNEANPFWEQSLYSKEWPLFDKCLAFGSENAGEGEVADPARPASKTPTPSKSTPTASKTSESEKPTPTKPKTSDEPTPTKSKTTDEPTPTKASSTKKPSTKPETVEPTPTKVSSTKKTSTKSPTEEPTPTKATTKKSTTTPAETTAKPTSHYKSSSTKLTSTRHSVTIPTYSPSGYSTYSWSNSTRTRTRTGYGYGNGAEPTSIVEYGSSGGDGSDTPAPAPPAYGEEKPPRGGDEYEASKPSSGSGTPPPAYDHDVKPYGSSGGSDNPPSYGYASKPTTTPPKPTKTCS